MKRADLDLTIYSDDYMERIGVEPTSTGIQIQTSGIVEITNKQAAELRDHLTLILETES